MADKYYDPTKPTETELKVAQFYADERGRRRLWKEDTFGAHYGAGFRHAGYMPDSGVKMTHLIGGQQRGKNRLMDAIKDAYEKSAPGGTWSTPDTYAAPPGSRPPDWSGILAEVKKAVAEPPEYPALFVHPRLKEQAEALGYDINLVVNPHIPSDKVYYVERDPLDSV